VRLALLALCLPGQARAGRGSEDPSLAVALRAMREQRYEAASRELDSLLKRGHLSNRELVALHALRAEVAAIMEGPAVSEAEFRRMLVLAPDHAPPRDTPVFSAPFTQAERWVGAHGAIDVEERRAATPKPGAPVTIAVAVLSDPFAMIVGAHLYHRALGAEAYTLVAGQSLRPTLPAQAANAMVEYYVEVVDGAENVVAQLGSADEPLSLEVGPELAPRPAPKPVSRPVARLVATPRATPVAVEAVRAPALVSSPRRSHPGRVAGAIFGSIGLGLLGAAIGVDVTGRDHYDQLVSSCAPMCSQASVDDLHTSEQAAIGLYASAGALLVTSVVLLSVDLARGASRR
jgi:hypothetical protein